MQFLENNKEPFYSEEIKKDTFFLNNNFSFQNTNKENIKSLNYSRYSDFFFTDLMNKIEESKNNLNEIKKKYTKLHNAISRNGLLLATFNDPMKKNEIIKNLKEKNIIFIYPSFIYYFFEIYKRKLLGTNDNRRLSLEFQTLCYIFIYEYTIFNNFNLNVFADFVKFLYIVYDDEYDNHLLTPDFSQFLSKYNYDVNNFILTSQILDQNELYLYEERKENIEEFENNIVDVNINVIDNNTDNIINNTNNYVQNENNNLNNLINENKYLINELNVLKTNNNYLINDFDTIKKNNNILFEQNNFLIRQIEEYKNLNNRLSNDISNFDNINKNLINSYQKLKHDFDSSVQQLNYYKNIINNIQNQQNQQNNSNYYQNLR